MEKIIGREKEIKIFDQILTSNQAEFVAVYGRRRVGKTYLIHQTLSNKGIYLECTGTKDGKMRDQLKNFMFTFQSIFYPALSLQTPKNWHDAFTLLTNEINKQSSTQKFIIFLDELPWLAAKRSKFLQELDYFWNTQWSRIPHVKLIVCGSAASWILDNLINAKGGLHNRITRTVLLEPFSLSETNKFLRNLGVKLTAQQVLEVYMVMGGIPFYLNQIQKDKSVTQNINDICFMKEGLLYSEFNRLFKSLFEAHELNLKIVREIAKYRYGIPFNELAKKLDKTAGGRFSNRLYELEAAGFIQKLLPFGKEKRDHYYRINDEYIMFYLHWIEEVAGKIPQNSHYWLKTSKSASWKSWAGYAFEIVCSKHINKVINALGLNQISCLVSSWKSIPTTDKKEPGAQIDLLLDREDDAITICEIKHSCSEFIIDKAYAKNLMNKLDVFQKNTNTKKQIFLAMITTKGLKKNAWSEDLVNNVVELKDLL